MLPARERGLPRDRAVTRLHELLAADAGYDWAAAMLEAPPPAPVEHRVYARGGIENLRQEELLAVAEAFVLDRHDDCGGRVRDHVLYTVERRGLVDQLERRVGQGLVRRALGAAAGGWSYPAELDRPWCHEPCPDDVELPAEPVEEEDAPWW